MPSARPSSRLLRGVLAASLATAVALGGHVAGGGALPSLLGTALPWWLSIAVCTVLAGRRSSLLRTGGAVLLSQGLFHALFMVGTPAQPTVALVAPPGSHLGHGAHHGAGHGAEHGLGDAVHTAASHAAMGGHADHGGLPMLLGHLVAAVVTTLLLHHGELLLRRTLRLVRRLAGAVGGLDRAPSLPVLDRERPSRWAIGPMPSAPVRREPLTAHRRRGPPSVPCVA